MTNLNQYNLLKTLSFCFVFLTLVGVIINYSSIPQADMWSNFELIYEFKQKNYQYLFSQHNEHRIFIPRLLYLLDYYLFNNGYYLLYFLNISLFFVIYYYLNRFFRENYFLKQYDNSWYFFTLGILFFWGQKSNFIWAYQSQFLLAYLFPLLSIYYISKNNENRLYYLFLSILFAFLSIGTMANGLFVVPILFLYLIFNDRLKQSFLFLFFGFLSFILYFYNFTTVTSHADFLHFLHRIHNVIVYYFVLSGNLFSFMVGKGNFGILFAGLVGFILNGLMATVIFKNFYQVKKDYLIFIFLFIVISLFSIAVGRENFGLKSAISSRYITPSVLFLCISIFYFFKYSFLKPINISKIFLLFLLALAPYQLTAIKNKNDKNINDLTNVVSFMMGIDNNIPHFESISDTTYFIKNNILIFSEPLLKAIIDTNNDHLCDLKNIKHFKLLELKNNEWYEITTMDINPKKEFFKLYNKDGVYSGFIYNTSLVENLIYSNHSYKGFTKQKNDEEGLYYCK